MPEIAINVPFEAGEVIDVILDEFKTRMRGLSPLQGNKEYAAFSADFQVKLRLRRSGETPTDAKETLAWGKAEMGDVTPQGEPGPLDPFEAGARLGNDELVTVEHTSHFESRDPNVERQARDMPLTVEGNDGKGGKARRKVRVKGA